MITRYEGKKSSLDTVLIEMKFGSPCEEHAYFTLFNKNATLASLGLQEGVRKSRVLRYVPTR